MKFFEDADGLRAEITWKPGGEGLHEWQRRFFEQALGVAEGGQVFRHSFDFGGRGNGKRFCDRLRLEDWLLFMERAEIRGDDLYVEFPDGSDVVGVGFGRLLLEDAFEELSRIIRESS